MISATQTNLTSGPADLQAAYSRARVAWAAEAEAARVAGFFQAPEHLRPVLQSELGLPEPLRLDETLAEAA